MGVYGDAAVKAARLAAGAGMDPRAAWLEAISDLSTEAGRQKSCPKCAFLGLCGEGAVAGIPAGTYTRSAANSGYAGRAIEVLRKTLPDRLPSPRVLWDEVLAGDAKKHNEQMDVVLALWRAGLILA